ncbi:CBS domain-containing protein [Neptunomonas phycophila]|uniref:CBS domain-containing protein n=1 Tax=Neptunomonas phycophila TaxID=1572645 RepID=UPI001BE53E64|nr:CBS domain-containing protein [Neptunomonas phycophila]MBT3147344.1 CBS domain-containing protein [Neptunomonas phycophila]
MALLIYDNGNLVKNPADSKFTPTGVATVGNSQGARATVQNNANQPLPTRTPYVPSSGGQPANTTRSTVYSSRAYQETSRKSDSLQDRRRLNAIHVMSAPVITTSQFDTVKNALQKMHTEDIDHLVVVNNSGHPLGVVTDGELLRHGAESNSFIENLLTNSLVAVSPDTLVRDIALIFMEQKVSCVPVINSEHQVAGIICRSDLLRLLVSGPNMEQRV